MCPHAGPCWNQPTFSHFCLVGWTMATPSSVPLKKRAFVDTPISCADDYIDISSSPGSQPTLRPSTSPPWTQSQTPVTVQGLATQQLHQPTEPLVSDSLATLSGQRADTEPTFKLTKGPAKKQKKRSSDIEKENRVDTTSTAMHVKELQVTVKEPLILDKGETVKATTKGSQHTSPPKKQASSAEKVSNASNEIFKETSNQGNESSTQKQNDQPKQKEMSTEIKAPSKMKTKKLKFDDQVLSHMLMAFKPFTMKSLATELATTEAVLHNTMLSLTDKGLVQKKDFNKGSKTKTLYWANHGAKAKEVDVSWATPQEMQTASQELRELQTKRDTLHQALHETTDELDDRQLDLKLVEAEATLKEWQTNVRDVKTRLQQAKANQQKSVARGNDSRRLKLRINHMRAEWKKRKDKCMDFVEMLADGMEKKPKDVMKLLDIESDESAGVALPPKKDV